MVLVQPFLEFEPPQQEPFPLSQACERRLSDAIDTVFECATSRRAHVILFPEFALPGVAGVQRAIERLSAPTVAAPTILIAGVSGLSKEQYELLCRSPEIDSVAPANAPQRVQDAEWVNTSITVVKEDDSALRLWVQPKLSASWPEANYNHQAMFKGGAVRIFRARFDNDVPCRFLALLCFDWVGQEDGQPVPEALLNGYDQICRATDAPHDLQWVFVLQHNPKPNHATVLGATHRFLTQTVHPFVRRRDAAVIMTSTASSQQPTRRGSHGFSSIVFGPQAPFDRDGCRPTFATQSSRLRQSEVLGPCQDAVFREMGECLHLADVRVPNFVVADATDRTAPLEQAEVFPLFGDVVDPRIPGEQVPAVVKWVNDELDEAPDFCARYFDGEPMEAALRRTHGRILDGYRGLRSQDLELRIEAACAARTRNEGRGTSTTAEVDTRWDVEERGGLHHVIQTLTLVGGAASVSVVDAQLHGRLEELGVEIAAICGTTHPDCMSAFKKFAARTHSPILFVSQDDQNAPLLPREVEAFADPRGRAAVKVIDSQALLHAARTKPPTEYQQFVEELANVDERPII